MRSENIQPRRRLLDIWAVAAEFTMREGRWSWGDAHGSNSISDAQQLLCFLLPATEMPELRLEDVNDISPDAAGALAAFGGNAQIPRVLVGALEEFAGRYTNPDGTCDFSGGELITAKDPAEAVPDDQRLLHLVPSYISSITLCLSAMGFIDEYDDKLPQRSALHPRLTKLRASLSRRLTAALVGMLRAFTLNLLIPDSDYGRNLLNLINQDEVPQRLIVAQFTELMEAVRGRLGEARLGVQKAGELEDPDLLFEIGWTWGIASDAPVIDLRSQDEEIGRQTAGVAASAPFLYFTMQAVDAIEQLVNERTRVLGLLNEEQERLAAALSIRRDLTQRYWSVLARFGESWPLEDLPWRTVDGEESDYFSLLVCAVVIQDLRERNATEDDLRRLEPLLTDLANRARITRRPLREDQMADLHWPGLLLELETTDPIEVVMAWRVRDFAPVLFKRACQLARLTGDPAVRDRLLQLATAAWNHLQNRQIRPEAGTGTGLWDNPHRVFNTTDKGDGSVSWQMTTSVVDALVTSAGALGKRAARSQELVRIAKDMVSEAEFLLNQQLLSTPALANAPSQASLQRIREDMQRASSKANDQPSLALALAVNAVNQLDSIALSRQDVERGM
ncbi:MAG TPA: SCO2524 family protein [Actinocrinis sp.]|nr:SCO2524 family protein [Actinocrinis sp.]